jgi:hypothetical protein
MTDADGKLSPVARELMLLAYRRASGISISIAITKLGVSVASAARAFAELASKELMASDGATLKLTPAGRAWLIENQATFSFDGEKAWREIPARLLGDRVGAYEPYAPRLSKLDAEHFELGGYRSGKLR